MECEFVRWLDRLPDAPFRIPGTGVRIGHGTRSGSDANP
jgi:hypothetical protein